jgi:hypothetical protein
MKSVWHNLIDDFGGACISAREKILRAQTAEDVVRVIATSAQGQSDVPLAPSPEDDLLRSFGSAMVQAIHLHAINCLQATDPVSFEHLLRWHRRFNLDPCRVAYPGLYVEFESKLQRAACARWLLEARTIDEKLQ